MSPAGKGFPPGEGVIDFAGGITIHTSAGIGALVCAKILGPRRKYSERDGQYRPGNLITALLGTTFLWLGWFGFNAGSAGQASALTAVAVANTQLAACISGLSWMLLHYIYHRKASLVAMMNGTVAGLAGITPASGFVNPEWALLIGLILGVVSFFSVILKQRFELDDALDVTLVHGLTGVIGSLSNGFFSTKDINPMGQDSIISGRPIQLAYQLLGVTVALGWSLIWTLVILIVLNKTIGIRVSDEDETIGLGYAEHGEFVDTEYYKRKMEAIRVYNQKNETLIQDVY